MANRELQITLTITEELLLDPSVSDEALINIFARDCVEVLRTTVPVAREHARREVNADV